MSTCQHVYMSICIYSVAILAQVKPSPRIGLRNSTVTAAWGNRHVTAAQASVFGPLSFLAAQRAWSLHLLYFFNHINLFKFTLFNFNFYSPNQSNATTRPALWPRAPTPRTPIMANGPAGMTGRVGNHPIRLMMFFLVLTPTTPTIPIPTGNGSPSDPPQSPQQALPPRRPAPRTWVAL